MVSQFPSCRFSGKHSGWPGSTFAAGPCMSQVSGRAGGGLWLGQVLPADQSELSSAGGAPRVDFSFPFLSLTLTCNKLDSILCCFFSFSDIINGAQEKCVLPPMDGYPHCEGKIKVRQKGCPFVPILLNLHKQPLASPTLPSSPQRYTWASEPFKGVI